MPSPLFHSRSFHLHFSLRTQWLPNCSLHIQCRLSPIHPPNCSEWSLKKQIHELVISLLKSCNNCSLLLRLKSLSQILRYYSALGLSPLSNTMFPTLALSESATQMYHACLLPQDPYTCCSINLKVSSTAFTQAIPTHPSDLSLCITSSRKLL